MVLEKKGKRALDDSGAKGTRKIDQDQLHEVGKEMFCAY
jgi:hypothetical protein